MEDMEDMEKITFAGQNYYLKKGQVKSFRKRLVLATFKQNYSTEAKYSKFIFEYGENLYIVKYVGLTDDMVFDMIENGEDGLEGFYNENVEIKESEREITFISAIFNLDFSIGYKVKKAFKEQTIAYFEKRFFPEAEEDFKFLSEFIPPVVFCDLYEILINAEKQQENIEFVRNAIVYYVKKLNILGRFGVNEFKFAQLELDLQIKFLALMSIYKNPERINSIIIFFNSDLLTDEERNNFIKIILDEFLKEDIDKESGIKDFSLKSNVVSKIGINQTTNEVMFNIIKNKLFLPNTNERKFELNNLKEKFNEYEDSALSFENKDFFEENSPTREVYIKYSPEEMINLILFVYDHSQDTLRTSNTYEELIENVKKNDTLAIEILSKQMLNTFEILSKQMLNTLLKGTELAKSLQQKEQIIFANAQEIFDNIHNVEMGNEERKKYRKALAKAMYFAKVKIYTEYFINAFRKCTSKRWWQREKTMEEKLKIVNDIYTNSVEGKSEMQIEALTKAKRIVTNELLSKEYEQLNEEINEFEMNNSQTSEEIFDSGERLEKYINSSSQPENVKKVCLKK